MEVQWTPQYIQLELAKVLKNKMKNISYLGDNKVMPLSLRNVEKSDIV